MVSFNEVERQARYLASENRKADPEIREVYWFPDDSEVRLVEVHVNVPASLGGYVEPFYFRASPEDDLPLSSGVALIRPEEYRKLALPEGWGAWDDAIEIEDQE